MYALAIFHFIGGLFVDIAVGKVIVSEVRRRIRKYTVKNNHLRYRKYRIKNANTRKALHSCQFFTLIGMGYVY